MSLNVVIPMAGLGSRFTNYGFKENKYLLPINKNLTKMIEKAILTLNIHIPTCFIFILREEKEKEKEPDNELRDYLQSICTTHHYECKIISVSQLTEGPACTTYMAKDIIDNDMPLIVSNSDQILDWNFNCFYETCNEYDGCVLTYSPSYELILGKTDKHSFVRCDEHKKAVEFTEKTIISKEALVGVHYYKKGRYFIEACDYLFHHNIRAPNGEFYLSYTYQAMLNMGGYTIGTHHMIETDIFYPVGEPEDYFKYYNLFSPFQIHKLFDFHHFNNIHNVDVDFITKNKYFTISYKSKGEKIILNNEFVIIMTEHPIVFLSGKNKTIKCKEDTFFLRVFDVEYDQYLMIHPQNYTRGWMIGDFIPSIKKTSEFEVGLLSHYKNEEWGFHYHQQSVEINILLKGKMNVNDKIIEAGDIFIFDKNIISCPKFLEDCKVVCIKIPSFPNDKILI